MTSPSSARWSSSSPLSPSRTPPTPSKSPTMFPKVSQTFLSSSPTPSQLVAPSGAHLVASPQSFLLLESCRQGGNSLERFFTIQHNIKERTLTVLRYTGVMHEFLQGLLELNLSKKAGVILGVEERGLASSIVGALGIECDASERSLEIIRGIRQHAEKLLAGLEMGDLSRSQLGLGHAYSRGKVKFNVNRSDNMIIQAIALLDQLDKDVNTFSMRVREWYGWHFPELVRIVSDNNQYARVISYIGDKATLTEDKLEGLAEILDDNDTLARNVLDAARASMGTDISPIDHLNIANFATRVIHLFAYRKSLQIYLSEKMGLVAPNLATLIGDTVGARLISHAGSLTNLSKYPASTVQILGAEKALFRALKTKGNTPKYGLIYHVRSSFSSSCTLAHSLRYDSRLSSDGLERKTRDESRVSSPTSARSPPESTASPTRRRPSSEKSSEVKSRSDCRSTKLGRTR